MKKFDQIAEMMENVAATMDQIDTAVTTTPASPDSLEQISQKLGVKLSSTLQGPTPLAESPEQALLEAGKKVLTRSEQLTGVITQKIKDAMK